MKAWVYDGAAGGLEKNLYQPAVYHKPLTASLSNQQVMVEVISMALNPADYKIPELGLIAKAMVSTPASPGMDFCGRVAETGRAIDSLQIGELVFGYTGGPIKFGTLGQFCVVPKDGCIPLPAGVDVDDAAALPGAGLTAYQSIKGNVKEGDKIFINGGSGGVGTFAIQIAKILGCHVTVSCSGANAELCKSIGADEAIDYKSVDLIEELKKKGEVFSLVIDNVGTPTGLYKASNSFLLSNGKYIQVGSEMSLSATTNIVGNFMTPRFFGGGSRKYAFASVKTNYEDFLQLGRWMRDGKLKAVIDSKFEYEDARKAFEKLRTGRAKGKIIIHVGKK
ncbi:NAD(P)-binding protein [Mytilinidion resinicola]|uniref:NAD(P)-binding protein n=1 Tax=Mytilinidion resinicola TaxID=574789 RepID=A0A6A6Y865_9PEZI|nr:NAD(P)-binding protein [Mytilinidion resinicola]KAF2804743.1 NAD(P)-binding protein [Mytilinidion resinicola]